MNPRGMDRTHQSDRAYQHSRKDDDTNYDHVTMDMSEESNNNNSDNDSPRRDSRRRSSQSSGERDYYRTGERFSEDKGQHKSRDLNFVSHLDNNKDGCGYSRRTPENTRSKYVNDNYSMKEHANMYSNNAYRGKSNEKQTCGSFRDHSKKSASTSDRSCGDEPINKNDESKKYGYKKSEKESSKRYDQECPDKKERDSLDRRDRDLERRHEDKDRDRHGSYHRDKYDKRHSNEKRSGDDRKRERSRSRDRNSSSYRKRSSSGDRDRSRNYFHRSDGPRRSGSRERKSFKRSRSRDRSPASNMEYKPSYKVSKKLQAMDKMGLQIKTPDGSMATAQMLLQQTLAQQVEKVKNATGIELPKYYNPAAMNPLKYANQIQKRKLLWGNKSKETPTETVGVPECSVIQQPKPSTTNKWQGTKFAQDTDGKVASKFMRLMGIKDPNAVQSSSTESTGDIVKKQEEMFEAMQAQYEVARATTHTMRGVGLGFSSHNKPY